MSRNPLQNEVDWHGLYKGETSRDDLLFIPASNAHPAKMSLPLLVRILDTMEAWGWLVPGATVIDPFNGRGSTGLVWAARHPANRAVGIEIEPHFVEMTRANVAHAEARLGRKLAFQVLQGDSRRTDELLAAKGGLVRTSPPYGAASNGGGISKAMHGEGDYPLTTRRPGNCYQPSEHGTTPGQIGNLRDDPAALVTSPPYGQGVIGKADVEKLRALTQDPSSNLYGRDPNGAWFQALAAGYVNSPGNIDNLREDGTAAVTSPPYERAFHGDSGIDESKLKKPGGRNFQAKTCHGSGGYGAAGVTSPPYEQSLGSDDPDKRGGLFRDPKRRNDRTLTGTYGAAVTSPPYGTPRQGASGFIPPHDTREIETDTASNTPGQIGSLADVSITSPPYEAQNGGHPLTENGPLSDPALYARHAAANADIGYAENTPGQIGATQSESYADACGAVYAACARAGIRYMAVVTKDPTRNGKLRRIGKLTARLLRAAGYRVVAWRRAWLFESDAQLTARMGQASLFDDLPESSKLHGRLSFFRRLHLAKGGIAAQHEDIYFAVLETGGAGASVTSPPYQNANTGGPPRQDGGECRREVYGETPGQIGALRCDE